MFMEMHIIKNLYLHFAVCLSHYKLTILLAFFFFRKVLKCSSLLLLFTADYFYIWEVVLLFFQKQSLGISNSFHVKLRNFYKQMVKEAAGKFWSITWFSNKPKSELIAKLRIADNHQQCRWRALGLCLNKWKYNQEPWTSIWWMLGRGKFKESPCRDSSGRSSGGNSVWNVEPF